MAAQTLILGWLSRHALRTCAAKRKSLGSMEKKASSRAQKSSAARRGVGTQTGRPRAGAESGVRKGLQHQLVELVGVEKGRIRLPGAHSISCLPDIGRNGEFPHTLKHFS